MTPPCLIFPWSFKNNVILYEITNAYLVWFITDLRQGGRSYITTTSQLAGSSYKERARLVAQASNKNIDRFFLEHNFLFFVLSVVFGVWIFFNTYFVKL